MKSSTLLFLLLLTIFYSCGTPKNMPNDQLVLKVKGTSYDLKNLDASQGSLQKATVAGEEMRVLAVQVDENLKILRTDLPEGWTESEAIGYWLDDTVETWKRNAIGLRRVKPDCPWPCEEMTFTFALEGIYYYSRAIAVEGQLIRFEALYDDANQYAYYRSIFDRVGR